MHAGSKKGVENEYEVYFAEIRAINDHMIFYLVKILKIGIFLPLKSVSNFIFPDFSKINLIFIFYTLFRACMQKSADGAYIYILHFLRFLFSKISRVFYKKV